MTGKRILVHTLFLLALPIVVAWFGLSVWSAIALVLLMLAWRWMITLSGILAPAKVPDLELETIAASHFVEKVRWCMDRLGVAYSERQWVGVLGVFTTGRSVPRLKVRTGIVRSSIGNSPEILRYLWGAYGTLAGDRADFLEPTEARIELEKKLDLYGVNLQVWIYYHVLDDRELTLHAWGCNSPAIPAWQRHVVKAIYPLLAAFLRKALQVTDVQYGKSKTQIESTLAEVEAQLADGRISILGDAQINFTDITFAALSGLWAMPAQYGRDKADEVRITLERAPRVLRDDSTRWTQDYPHVARFIKRLYQEQRLSSDR